MISVKDFVHKGSVVKFWRTGGTIRLPEGSTMRVQEKCGVYVICLNVVSGHGDSNDAETIGALNKSDVPPPPTSHLEKRKPRGFNRSVP